VSFKSNIPLQFGAVAITTEISMTLIHTYIFRFSAHASSYMLNIGRVFTMVCITILVGNLLSVTTTQDNNYAGETTSILVNDCNVCVLV